MQSNRREQRVCGLLGGLTYVSTVDYYNYINRMVNKALPGHGSRIHIVSLNVFYYVKLLEQNEWSKAIDYLMEGIRQLVNSGIDFLIIGSNTSHIAVPRITDCYPYLVVLHIGDAVAHSIKQKKIHKIGFLGTRFAMKFDSQVVQRLIEHELEVIFPDEEEIVRLNDIIMNELSFNIVTEESKQTFLKVIQRLNDEQNIEGIVLGCTEIPVLIKQNDIPHVLLFDSTQLHVQLAVDYQIGRQSIKAVLP
ncbi:unnamed protein product [Rotaria magnacalcarata]|uniref:Aspartate racemase n=1 Tax=Rotaria magnacalcarata TaxID=392030 RepID=A0A816M5C5_9BILA|nr:unnamed protein product [Rotaria magnacalcarata]